MANETRQPTIESATRPLFHKGIYTPQQAAHYARVTTQMMLRWIHGSEAGQSAVRAQLTDDPDRFVTFLDLVQALAIRAIRHERKISLQLIREVVRRAESEYDLPYPFAQRHTTYLFDDDIVIRTPDDRLIQITGKYKHNQLIKPVVELYAEDLIYKIGPLPICYKAYSYKGQDIILDPEVRFGAPCVMPCGFLVDDLLTAVSTEGTAEKAAAIYEIEKDVVIAAQRYDDWLLAIAA